MKKNIFILGLLLMQVFAFGQTLDTTFGVGGKVVTPVGNYFDVISSMQQQTNGKIIATGLSFEGSGVDVYRTFVCRYNTNGTLDNSFGSNGTLILPYVIDYPFESKIKLQVDGKILIATNEGAYVQHNNFLLIRLNSDGSYDQNFGTNGVVITDFEQIGNSENAVRSIELQADNKIILAGYNNATGEFIYQSSTFAVARYNTDGSLDTSFANNGIFEMNVGSNSVGSNSIDGVQSVKLQSNGKIILGGYTDAGNTVEVSNSILMRLNGDGSVDTTFGTNGIVITNLGENDKIKNLLITNDDKIIASSVVKFNDNSNSKIAFTKYEANGSLDTSFGNNGIVTTQLNNTLMLDNIYDIALQADNKIVANGYTKNETFDMFILRYNIDGSLDATFDNDGVLLTDFDLNFDGAYSILVQSDGKIVAGGFSGSSPIFDLAMARYTFEDLNVLDSNNQFYSLYPNPTKQFLNLKTSQRVENISIVDISGKIVFTQNNNLETIDVSKLAKGIYFLNAKIEGKTVVEKFIKE